MPLPAISDLPRLESHAIDEAIGLLFEPCPELTKLVEPEISAGPDTWPDFIESVRYRLHQIPATDSRVPAIVGAHPRLGATKIESVSSQEEQKSLASASAVESEALAQLNEEYEKRFPGLRYVVFVAGRPRSMIMEDMRRRIAAGDRDSEISTAFDSMCDIALDRVSKLGVDQ